MANTTSNQDPNAAAAGTDEEPVPSGDAVHREIVPGEALARVLPALKAIPLSELVQVNAGIPLAVSTVLGALPKIKALRSAIIAVAPFYDIKLFDQLEDAAVASNETHGDYLIVTKSLDELSVVMEEALPLRDTLITDLHGLAHRGLIDPASFDDLKGPVGYLNVATDLNVVSKALRSKWSVVAGKSATTLEELDRAAKLQLKIIRLVGLKNQSEAATAAAAEMRSRAFTYFLRVYDHVERGVTFVAWENKEYEKIVPTLYANRGKRRANGHAEDELEPTLPVTPVVPATTTAGSTPATGTANRPAGAPKAPGSSGGTPNDEDPFM